MAVRYELANGLTVVFEEQRAAPVCAFQVWVRAGSADEGQGEVGLAHLHEHMLFKGTARRGVGEIARSIEAHGGEINAWTSFDHTVYHVVIASRFARVGLDVLADALRASAFDEGELAREIEVVCEEIKRSTDMPGRRASKQLFEQAYARHPYGRPVIGFEESVRAQTRARVLGFYRKHYRPERLVLAAAGDLDADALRRWVDELFGGEWRRAEATPDAAVGAAEGAPLRAEAAASPRLVEPERTAVGVQLTSDPAKEAYLHVAFQGPPALHPDAPVLDVLALLVGQGDASRLAIDVRRRRGLAKSVGAWAWTPVDPGLVALSLVTEPEKASAALGESLRVLAGLTAADVADEELATFKAIFEADAILQRETVQGIARRLGFYEATGGGLEEEARYYEAVARVTAADVRRVAERYLRFDRALVTGLLPAGTALSEDEVHAALEAATAQRGAPAPPRDLPPPASGAGPLAQGRPSRASPGLVQERLPSGALVLVREERSLPHVALRAVFPGGLRYERDEDNGLTALLGRTLPRGTRTLRPEQVSHLVDQLAGSLGAVPGRSTFGLRAEFLSKHFERGFELCAELLREPAFPEAEVRRERGVLLQEVGARDDRPASVAFELFAKALFPAHPYRLSVIGERASLERLGSAELAAYHARHVDWPALTLCVVGDVDAEEIIARARAAFGAARGSGVAPPEVREDPPLAGPVELRRTLAKAQAHVVLGFRGARVSDRWRRALEVLSNVLSGQSGRLFLELRDKRSMAYSVGSSLVEGVDPGSFSVYIGTSPEKVDAAVAGLRDELRRVCDERVGADELERAKVNLLGAHDIGLQRKSARAAVMALDACFGLGAEHFLQYPEEIQAVSADDVRDVARRVIELERSVLVVVGP